MNIWSTVLQSLKKKVSLQAYNDWLKPTFEVSHDEKILRVKVPNDRFREHLEKQYNPMIQENPKRNGVEGAIHRISPQGPTQLTLSHMEDSRPQQTASRSPLNPRYTFENFVAGPFNQFAQAAASAVAANLLARITRYLSTADPALARPTFFMQSGHSVYQNNPSVKLIYISTEEFTNEFIRALRLERTQEFRERHRTADLLLIDDIHMLAGKNQTQEEFFHTFNALYEHQKQVVLASDLLPRESPDCASASNPGSRAA